MDIVKVYQKAAADFADLYDVNDSHVISIIASVMMTRDGQGIPGGGFVQAVVDNDLYSAISRADSTSLKNIKVISAANKMAHLNY